MLKPAATCVSHVGAGTISAAFPDSKQRIGWEVERLGVELVPIWDDDPAED